MSELEEQSRRVRMDNAQEQRASELTEAARVRAIVTETTERIMKIMAVKTQAYHAFIPHVNETDHPQCRRCSWPKDHPVHEVNQ